MLIYLNVKPIEKEENECLIFYKEIVSVYSLLDNMP